MSSWTKSYLYNLILHTAPLTAPTGTDLEGNTFWEFRERGSRVPANGQGQQRMRRIVRYPSATHHGDVAVSPAWHQWLRHVRAEPPSVAEQLADLARREQMRMLAAAADARWEAKPRVDELGDGGERRRGEAGGRAAVGAGAGPDVRVDEEQGRQPHRPARGRREGGKEVDDPWKKAKGGSRDEGWQPKAWDPAAGAKQ